MHFYRVLLLVSRSLVALVLAVAAATSILGKPLVTSTSAVGWKSVLLLALILFAVQAFIEFLDLNYRKQSVFTEGNKNFVEYFEGWYADATTLKLYCKNLRWLEGVPNAKILARIKEVGSHAEIYCKDTSSHVAAELRNSGARLVKHESDSPMRFSLKTTGSDNESEVIIRSKVSEPNRGTHKKIWVRKLDDDYQCELAITYLEALSRLDNLRRP